MNPVTPFSIYSRWRVRGIWDPCEGWIPTESRSVMERFARIYFELDEPIVDRPFWKLVKFTIHWLLAPSKYRTLLSKSDQ